MRANDKATSMETKLASQRSVMATILITIMVIAVAGSGLMAGLFFVFSFSVMDALAQMPTSEGMKAMQLINRTILNPVFLSVFFGTALACMLVTIISAWQRPPEYGLAVAGACAYLFGGFMVTAVFHVPLNNALDKLPLDAPESNHEWTRLRVTSVADQERDFQSRANESHQCRTFHG